jgi:carbamoyl-phosphate synthase large subunit
MNVLLTGAARRNFLVHYFRAALGPRGRVIACEANTTAPALAEANEKIVVPEMDHPDYFNVLLSVCREKDVRLIVASNDLDLPGLARNAARFREVGAIAVVPSPEMVATSSDKWSAFLWLRKLGIATPETFLTLESARAALAHEELHFPLLIKPRWGTSSIGVELVHSQRELELAHEWGKIQLRRTVLAKMTQADPDRSFVFQQCVVGDEYGMDVVNDFDGNYAATLARRKLAMRGGNTDRAVSVIEPRLERLGRSLGKHLRHIGSVDCDVIVGERDCYVLDINPRLGGGYPFSHMAGANLPAALLAWAEGTEPNPAWLRCQPGVQSSRYDGVMITGRAMPSESDRLYALENAPSQISSQVHDAIQ